MFSWILKITINSSHQILEKTAPTIIVKSPPIKLVKLKPVKIIARPEMITIIRRSQ
jgi:hypothetical protein